MSHKPKVAKLDGLAKLPHLTVTNTSYKELRVVYLVRRRADHEKSFGRCILLYDQQQHSESAVEMHDRRQASMINCF